MVGRGAKPIRLKQTLSPAISLLLLWLALCAVAVALAWSLPGLLWTVLAIPALLILNYTGLTQLRLQKRPSLLLALCALVALGAVLYSPARTILLGWKSGDADHRLLERPLAIFPSRLWEDRPQRLLLYAPHSQNVKLRWKSDGPEMKTTSLGEGVFRWDYNPKLDGLPPDLPASQVDLFVESDGDGRAHHSLPFYAAVTRPGQLSGDLESGEAVTASESTDEVLLFERTGRLRRIPVGDGPSCTALLPGGRQILVGHRYEKTLWLLDSKTGTPTAKAAFKGLVNTLAVSPDARSVALLYEGESPHLAIVKLPTLAVEDEIELPQAGEFVCFGRNAEEIVVSSRRGRVLLRVRKAAGSWSVEDERIALARPATTLCRGPQGRQIYFTATSGQLGGEQNGNHFVQDVLMTLDVAKWQITDIRPTQKRSEVQELAGSLDSGCGATGMALDSQNRLLIAFSGTHEVAMLPAGEGLDKRVDLSPFGLLCPRSVVATGSTTFLASFPAQSVVAVLNGEGEVQRVYTLGKGAVPSRQEGEVCFYEAANAGISCQSCHTLGETDYAAHDIGGAHKWGVLSLQGVADTGPYLRNASYPGLRDLHTVSIAEYRGFRRDAAGERADLLAEYIASLPLPVNPRQLIPDPLRLESERRGLKAFVKAQCTACHTFPATTNLAQVPNASLFGDQVQDDGFESLDVPSLRGVWQSAPFLHDQRAQDLDDVLTRENFADQHGRVSALTPAEREDLKVFLLSL